MKEINETDGVVGLGFFTGVRQLLIVGEGEVVIYKSVSGFSYPMTDGSGEVVTFSGDSPDDVLFNSEIENNSQLVRYSLECVSGQIKYVVAE